MKTIFSTREICAAWLGLETGKAGNIQHPTFNIEHRRESGGTGRPAFGVRRSTFDVFHFSTSLVMNTPREFLLLSNGTSVPWADVPEWSVDELVTATDAALDRGGRLCAWFGVPENSATRLVAVLAFDAENTLAVGRSAPVTKSYPSLTPRHPQAHLFEREVWEQHGLVPEGHPWLKPVRRSAGGSSGGGGFFQSGRRRGS
jgi:hypothetical protein